MIGIKLKWIVLSFFIFLFAVFTPLLLLTLYIKSKRIDRAFTNAIKDIPATEQTLNHLLVKDTKLYVLESVQDSEIDKIDLSILSNENILVYDHLKLEKACNSFLNSIFGEFGLKIFYRKSLVIKFVRLVNYMRFAKFVKNSLVLITIKGTKLEITAKSNDKFKKHEISFDKSDEPMLICKYIINVLQ
ncbi:hypothetical protein THOM_1401 [Trachipleistophora hominis]|uniref:Uncharacterized protein n=1 Tax=Trachipleistophora hominis TaxID=72359 RepID=L7JWD7_TRAHO|nr:hypothetical protein THOM_1401 [Trachipleistophora hominis]